MVTQRTTSPTNFIFPRVLGQDFNKLPDAIKQTHQTVGVSRWQGRCEVLRGTALWSRTLCAIFRFPPADRDIAVIVTKTVTPRGETWERRFGRHVFRSHLSAQTDGMHERFGPFSFSIGLEMRDGALYYPVTAGRLGPIPLPRWILPVSVAREFVTDGVFQFDVAIRAPVTKGLMVRYRGFLTAKVPDGPSPASIQS